MREQTRKRSIRRRDGSRRRGRRRATVVGIVLLTATGCATPDSSAPTTPASSGPSIGRDPAPVARLIERYNERIRLLDSTCGRGVLEFRWVDEGGKEHFEPQINARLWIDLPRKTALRGEKLGDVYLWLGSDDERYWMFDLIGQTRRLYVGRHDTFAAEDADAVLVRPVTLLDLVGLTPLPAFDPAAVDFDEGRGAWIITAPGAGGPMRVFLDPGSALPIRVESLDAGGRLVLYSRLGRDEAVQMPGMSALALPRMPTLIDITNPAGTVFVKLAFDEITTETQPRVFDLDGLTGHLRPQVIEGPGAR